MASAAGQTVEGTNTIQGSIQPLRGIGVPANGSLTGASTGQLYIDLTLTTGELWQNVGTPAATVWAKVGLQT